MIRMNFVSAFEITILPYCALPLLLCLSQWVSKSPLDGRILSNPHYGTNSCLELSLEDFISESC